MKATLAAEGKSLSNPVCKRGSGPDSQYSWHNENKIIILVLLLIGTVDTWQKNEHPISSDKLLPNLVLSSLMSKDHRKEEFSFSAIQQIFKS